MNKGVPASPSGYQPTASAASASSLSGIPNAEWVYTGGEIPKVRHELIYALGRLGDIYGPLPPAMFRDEGWEGNMLSYSHDLIAYAPCEIGWRRAIPLNQDAARWPR